MTLQDDGRRVKAAVAQGDVDNAAHIGTFVPGIGTTVNGSLKDYIRQMENLRQAAADQGNLALKDVATVAWLGYDAPGGFSPGNLPDITSPKLAQAGSDRLAGFLNGMQASREHGAGDAHMTLVGDSYGSTTSGMAATKVHDGVIDDLVLCGSPGMGTYNASDLHVAEGHRGFQESQMGILFKVWDRYFLEALSAGDTSEPIRCTTRHSHIFQMTRLSM